jgi:hypothetical protein
VIVGVTVAVAVAVTVAVDVGVVVSVAVAVAVDVGVAVSLAVGVTVGVDVGVVVLVGVEVVVAVGVAVPMNWTGAPTLPTQSIVASLSSRVRLPLPSVASAYRPATPCTVPGAIRVLPSELQAPANRSVFGSLLRKLNWVKPEPSGLILK